MQQVEIIIEAGVPMIFVKGVKGKRCKDVTRALESALGETSGSIPTPELFQNEKQTTQTGH